MDEKLKNEIIAYAKLTEPHECCGFVVLKQGENQPHFFPCENIAEDKENHFEISPDDYLRAEDIGDILALVHSHPNGKPKLSQADLQTQLYSQLDFWLVCDGVIHVFPKIPLLIGREFKHGKMDCYTLYRDFYRLVGYEMAQYEREDYWWEDGFNLYLDNIEKEGFERVTDQQELQVGDVILIQVGADVPNHAAIYIGDQMVLHHAPKRLSKRDLYDGYWLKHTHSIWRHKEWSKLDFMVPLNSLALSLI
ncbi:C40 family peptidase [Rodentibacter pneumotropicus]|uniref:C40 family peptidase n=1 Tax=Rodentibacter pneumotropicus TaxID=758 RepID=UPI00109D7039|nr:C40 family peptidase [Rodentibacter pneumotropicus]THA16134.1 phage tail protein [Rodentibacter pneumotropicus]